MKDYLEVISEQFHFPSQPGPYHKITEDAEIRIDFIQELQTGLSLSLDKKKGNNNFSADCGLMPMFYRLEVGRKISDSQNLGAIIQPEKLELNYNFSPSKLLFGNVLSGYGIGKSSRIGGNIYLGLPTPSTSSSSSSSSTNFDKLLKKVSAVGVITHETSNSSTEIKVSKMYMSDIEHRIAGVSFCYGLRPSLALGFELYYKFIQASGGGSVGARYRGSVLGIQYDLSGTCNVMGDLQLTSSIGIIPNLMSFSTRFNLNTNNMLSSMQFGTRIIGNPIIGGHEIPLCLKLRTDTNFENAIAFDFDTPFAGVSIGCFGKKSDLFKNYGINLSF
ncbi:hypothetical protein RB653_004470 [Dictyostelium firmibasis]|uniref:Uncharacterized protein n=1 Tax=Dictyostelium firmibasis TaxID=79012 RepID=A0AAN7U7J6_9MYCE